MRLAAFDYQEPETLGEALTILAQAGPKAGVKAGGTDLLVRMKQRTTRPELLVNLAKIGELDYIDADGGGLRLGAMTTLRAVETAPAILQRFPALAEAIGKIASLEIRNVATIGGNVGLDTRCWYFNQSHFWRQTHPPCFKTGGQVCHIAKRSKVCNALCSSDSVPVLIALGAKIKLTSQDGERTLRLEEFFTGEGRTVNVLRAGELLTEIQIPAAEPRTKAAFLKYRRRKAIDFPLASAAVAVDRDGGKCQQARIVLGGVSPAPVRAGQAESLLQGATITPDIYKKAGALAAKETSIVSSSSCSAAYRKNLVEVLVERALRQALERTERI